MTDAAKRLQIVDFISEFGMRADGLDMIDFEPTARPAGNANEAVAPENILAKGLPTDAARDMS